MSCNNENEVLNVLEVKHKDFYKSSVRLTESYTGSECLAGILSQVLVLSG